MELRRADDTDAEAVALLINRFFAEDGFSTTAEEVEARVPAFLTTPGNAAFLAFDGDEVVGVSTVTSKFSLESGKLGEIEDLYVLPSYRGRGVATALLGQAMLWARQEGFEALEVVVTPKDYSRKDRLVRWYARLGFVDTGRLVLHFGPDGAQ